MESRNDLTTDAWPSPPRDDPDNAPTDDTREKPQIRTPPPSPPPEQPKVPTAGKYKHSSRRQRPIGKTKCENVIYINQSKDIHIGSSNTYTVNVGGHQPKESSVIYNETPKIKELFASAEEINRDHLIFLSGHISASGWKLMARKLGFSDGRIEQIYVDNFAVGVREVIYQCLLEWIQWKPDDAIVSRISEVLWGCNEREAVDLFSNFMHDKK